MKRIGILTAGGDTPALNATIHGAVTRASELNVEVIGFIKGFSSLFNPGVPHCHLNPLYRPIPELDPTRGGTILGASRDYVDHNDTRALDMVVDRLKQTGVEGLICIGGDGTLNGMQPIADRIPTVLAPKTIDNDLGLNYRNEPDEWMRIPNEGNDGYRYERAKSRQVFHMDHMINYATPGYATSVFVSAWGVQRIRTTAESHRRIAIIEVMGRHSGYLALGSAYGQPDFILLPESPLNLDLLVEEVKRVYDLQKHVVIVCAEGVVDENGDILGAEKKAHDPAGNVVLTGGAEALRKLLIDEIGDDYFVRKRRCESARAAIFTRKVGHTQRGGRPIVFDRFYASQLGGKSVQMLLEGQNNAVAILQWNKEKGFYVDSFAGNSFRDRWGLIHAREMHPCLYDPELMRASHHGIEYLLPIFSNAIGYDDVEHIRDSLFNPGNLYRAYHSVNADMSKRIHFLDAT
ncbi:Pyrophosphate--fructose 6-phosphate 1-phosphotransferase [Planctomycetes bacterium Pan216]|uniref:6-phosphofructokinase n=1 Tax=Kolteria novifilia TaxID=2527975 RepID=A0A518BC07_9BACT|nr:Pyrophosphate--fructose 6-phosphate 1-phosphotransferase [Planctomycetes bacterium Pan216]